VSSQAPNQQLQPTPGRQSAFSRFNVNLASGAAELLRSADEDRNVVIWCAYV
jgi:hypothetical protein